MISPIFTTIVISFLCIMIYMKTTTNKFNTGDAAALEREHKANGVRKQSLDELNYIEIPFEYLPFDESITDETLINDMNLIKGFSDKKIVNFTGISNTDLKERYGVANLTLLTEYDQNFTSLVKALDSWGEHLINLEMIEDARVVLEYAVSIESDIKSTYVALAGIYAESFEFDQIDVLKSHAENLKSLMQMPILRALKEKSDMTQYVSQKINEEAQDNPEQQDIIDVVESDNI